MVQNQFQARKSRVNNNCLAELQLLEHLRLKTLRRLSQHRLTMWITTLIFWAYAVLFSAASFNDIRYLHSFNFESIFPLVLTLTMDVILVTVQFAVMRSRSKQIKADVITLTNNESALETLLLFGFDDESKSELATQMEPAVQRLIRNRFKPYRWDLVIQLAITLLISAVVPVATFLIIRRWR
jgi:hypothetical protein